jgi:hypothetical protein
MCSAAAGRGTSGESMRGECDNNQAMLQMSEHPRDSSPLPPCSFLEWLLVGWFVHKMFSWSSEAGDLSSPEVLSKGALEKAQSLFSRLEHLQAVGPGLFDPRGVLPVPRPAPAHLIDDNPRKQRVLHEMLYDSSRASRIDLERFI